MNKTTSNFINQLLDESELFKSTTPRFKPKEIFDFSGETLLITGAAGSIGGGITRQLIHCKYKRIILIDNAESPFYYLINELKLDDLSNVECHIADIRDEASMQWLFKTFKPTIIFHAAAYKHVPLMEAHPYEAIRLNILATQSLADLAIAHHVKKFIFISTDKAVNPIGVMGRTKHIAECYLKNLNTQNNTSFLITRFGNILGSNGSVVPLFIKQIKSRTPLTVINKTIARYFITKSKACHLILKIATYEKNNHCVFTFNMGQPIQILHLAEAVIDRFKNINSSINIMETTSLRPGEKLHEDIVSDNESLAPTLDKDIFMVINKSVTTIKPIDLNILKSIKPSQKPSEIKLILESFI